MDDHKLDLWVDNDSVVVVLTPAQARKLAWHLDGSALVVDNEPEEAKAWAAQLLAAHFAARGETPATGRGVLFDAQPANQEADRG